MREDGHVVITGGAGYIGSVLTEALLRGGVWVTIVDTLRFGGDSLLAYLPNPAFHLIKADICDKDVLHRTNKETKKRGAPPISAVVHLAAVVGFPACKEAGTAETWRVNMDGTRFIFEEAEALDVDRLLFSSTYSVYGVAIEEQLLTEDSILRPQSLYAESKIAGEEYLAKAAKTSRCSPLIYRLATLYGASPRMRFDLIINQFVLEAFSKGELLIYQRDFFRSYMHIRDAVSALVVGLNAPEEKVHGEIFNVGDKDGNYTKDEIVFKIQKALPGTKVSYKDISFNGDMRDVRVSYRKVKKILDFNTELSIGDGIDEILYLLQSGVIKDPYLKRFRNADFTVE
jgi:nucleoside-diphosphate-sugar epimerase